MPVITIWNRKGGTGKTTIAGTLGTALAFQPSILVDMDSQQSLTALCGLSIQEQAASLLTDVLQGRRPPKELVRRTPGDLLLVPGDASLDTLQERWTAQERPEIRFRNILQALSKRGFWVVVDAAPGAALPSRMALAAADRVLIPVTPGVQAADGLRRALHVIQNIRHGDPERGLPALAPDLAVLGVVLNQVQRPTAAQAVVLEMINKFCTAAGLRRLRSVIRARVAWEEAQLRHWSIWQLTTREAGDAKRDASALVDEIVAMMKEEQNGQV